MDYNKLKKYINNINNKLNQIESASISDLEKKYFNRNENIDMLIPYYDYEYLQKIHLKIFKTIKKIRSTSFKFQNSIISELLELKIKVDRLIINHPKYDKSKFKNEFEQSVGIHKKPYEIPRYIGLYKKRVFTNLLAEYLVSNKHILPDQSINFKLLFSKLKRVKPKKIVWQSDLRNLRAFFDILYSFNEVIKKPKHSDVFIQEHFVGLNKEKIESSYYANLEKESIHYDDMNITLSQIIR